MAADDFASLFAGSSSAERAPRAGHSPGQVVEGRVVQVDGESVFVDIGGKAEARLPRREMEDARGRSSVAPGDLVRATVRAVVEGAIELTVASSRLEHADTAALELARDAGTRLEVKVTKAVKGGVEVDVGGTRAFCPASQLEIGHAGELEPWVGRTLEVRILEVRDAGRSVVVSRRAVLEAERAEREATLRETLVAGAEVEGTVSSLGRHGVLVDLGGVEGFAHVSELGPGRVERIEDAVKVGEVVRARILSVKDGQRGLDVRVSLRAAGEAAASAPEPDEVLEGTVTRHSTFGLFVATPKGEGLVPLSELGLAPSSDPRRAYPVGGALPVVLLSRDARNGRLRFSARNVARVEERRNFREFAAGTAQASTLGSLGDVLRRKLGLPDAPPEPPAPPAPAPAAPPAPAPSAAALPPVPPAAAVEVARSSAPHVVAASRRAEPRADPPGIVRRRRGDPSGA
ncbi:MAG: S1 RNA-binding domain-containing protein [Polyangiaceae bacterium]|nr:S1 RNA-binding domain-containing protein [Polyangiaceae bacterium]